MDQPRQTFLAYPLEMTYRITVDFPTAMWRDLIQEMEVLFQPRLWAPMNTTKPISCAAIPQTKSMFMVKLNPIGKFLRGVLAHQILDNFSENTIPD